MHVKLKLNNFIARYFEQISQYLLFLKWIIVDSLFRKKKSTAIVLILGFLGVFFQVNTFGLLIYYVKNFSSGEHIAILGQSFDPRTSFALLILGSLLTSFCILLSTLSNYFSAKLSISMVREYDEFCGHRLLSLLSESLLYEPVAGAYSLRKDQYLTKLVAGDSRLLSRVMRQLISLVIPLLTVIVSMAALFHFEPFLTMMILIFLTIFVLLQYKVSHKAVSHSVDFEKFSPESRKEVVKFIKYLQQQPLNNSGRSILDRLYKKGTIKKQFDAYEGRFLAVENSQLVSGIFLSAILGMVLFTLGSDIISKGSGWGRLLAYVVALRFAMTYMQNVFTIITSVNRLYPQTRRYFFFVRDYMQKNLAPHPPCESYILNTCDEHLNGSQKDVALSAGMRVSLISPLPPNRYTLSSMTNSLFNHSENYIKNFLFHMRFITAQHSSPLTTLQKTFGLNNFTNWNDLKEWFHDDILWNKAQQQLGPSLKKNINLEMWDHVDLKIKFIVSLISAANSDCQSVMVDGKGLALFSQQAAAFYLNKITGKIIILVFNNELSRVGSYQDGIVAVIWEEQLLGIGSPDWFSSVRPQVEKLYDFGSKKKMKIDKIDNDDDFEDEMNA